MLLSAAQAQLVQQSYAAIQRKPENFSTLFYHRLLLRHPFARSLFPDDMTHQVTVFRQTIDALVAAIDDLAALRPVLADLAKRHVGYGVKAQHYALVGDVLIDTFADMLGDDFTPPTREAWSSLYAATADMMVREAYPSATTEEMPPIPPPPR